MRMHTYCLLPVAEGIIFRYNVRYGYHTNQDPGSGALRRTSASANPGCRNLHDRSARSINHDR